MKCFGIASSVIVAICLSGSTALAQKPTQAPPEMFKDLDDAIVGNALIIRGKQLFIDDYLIEELRGVQKSLHQPVKHAKNPVLVRDQPWEEAGPGFGTVIYDKEERLFKLWYEVAGQAGGPEKVSVNRLCYATSKDGVVWKKPIVDVERHTNSVTPPKTRHFQIIGLFKDDHERNPERRA